MKPWVGFPRAPRKIFKNFKIFYGQGTHGAQEKFSKISRFFMLRVLTAHKKNFQIFLWLGCSGSQEKFPIKKIENFSWTRGNPNHTKLRKNSPAA